MHRACLRRFFITWSSLPSLPSAASATSISDGRGAAMAAPNACSTRSVTSSKRSACNAAYAASLNIGGTLVVRVLARSGCHGNPSRSIIACRHHRRSAADGAIPPPGPTLRASAFLQRQEKAESLADSRILSHHAHRKWQHFTFNGLGASPTVVFQ